jgi:hypothetical protein
MFWRFGSKWAKTYLQAFKTEKIFRGTNPDPQIRDDNGWERRGEEGRGGEGRRERKREDMGGEERIMDRGRCIMTLWGTDAPGRTYAPWTWRPLTPSTNSDSLSHWFLSPLPSFFSAWNGRLPSDFGPSRPVAYWIFSASDEPAGVRIRRREHP